ncbi:FAD-dependent oxidoreductase [Glaciibacter sp. 2TAF33]|uniref:FAD-dependent oxidoreductase n=1 Tax=Glaciibacter sp. 2TAF33 TaxID=3233015 RepID=UPI003F901F0F
MSENSPAVDAGAARRQLPIILLALSDEPARDAVLRELERRYTLDYRVVATPGADEARTALAEASAQGGRVALLLADDSAVGVAEFTGETLFTEARRRFPDLRRGLVIEWGSWAERSTTAVVLELMATGQIDYYVIRPWHSPDEYFHRTVTEFLLEFERSVNERPREVTVIGDDDQPRTHELRSLLARGGVPHGYVAPGSAEGRALLAGSGVSYTGVPLVRLIDGRVLSDPSNADLAASYGLSTSLPDNTEVDVAIVGAGPAGLAAAVYAASEGLTAWVVEREAIGGQAGSSSLIRNYLGFSRGISGSELAQRAYQQAWVFGAGFAHSREVVGLEVDGDGCRLTVASGSGASRPPEQLRARSVVIAVGVDYRRLDVPALEPFAGAAVFYGASVVEAKAQAGKAVHVVGGGNSAGQAALHLARYASSVTLLVRGATLAESMSSYLIDQLDAAGVHVETGAEVIGGGGAERLDHLVVRDRLSGTETRVASDALFLLIGASPHTAWLPPQLLRDKWGYVLTGADVVSEAGAAWSDERMPDALETSVPGVFAVGDVRRGSVKRVASAVGEGSVVVSAVHGFLARGAAGKAAGERAAGHGATERSL